MSEQSQYSDYFQLINSFVELRRDEEQVIRTLGERIEFLDSTLLDVAFQVAQQKKKEGKRGDALWLLLFRVQLARLIEVPDIQPYIDEAVDPVFEEHSKFLAEVFEYVETHCTNPRTIHEFFYRNRSKLNNQLATEFSDIASEMLCNMPVDVRPLQALVVAMFGDFIQNFSEGRRDINKELALAAYQQAHRFMVYGDMPDDWVELSLRIAQLLCFRIRGSRAENIEQVLGFLRSVMETVDNRVPLDRWGDLMMMLGIVYLERVKGSRADNIEEAIATYQQIMSALDKKAMPSVWGKAMANMANAYRVRIKGDASQNLEAAIVACQQALETITYTEMPVEWVQLKTNLAAIHTQRIKGDKAKNIETAIAIYTQLLASVDMTVMPLQWAAIMDNLGIAYENRIQGDKAENIEQAINAYKKSLEVNTRQQAPIIWSQTINNLAVAFQNRIQGDRAENIEQAIEYYQLSLEVRTQDAMPIEWAKLTVNLASAYRQRLRADPAENTEKSILLYQQAFSILTYESTPEEWVVAMNNLAAAYADRKKGNRANNIKQAIALYQQVLDVTTPESNLDTWMRAMFNISSAYADHTQRDEKGNIERAIVGYQQTLKRIEDLRPIEWAKGMYDLANVYIENRRNSDDYTKLAIDCCQKALSIAHSYQLPVDCQKTNRLLGNIYLNSHQWSEAVMAYQRAIEAANILYQASLFSTSQHIELENTGDLFHCCAYAQAKAGQLEAAVVTIEQGRTRSLNEFLERENARLTTLEREAPAVYAQYQNAGEALRQLEIDERLSDAFDNIGTQALSLSELRNRAIDVRTAFQEAVDAICRQPGYEDFLRPIEWHQLAPSVLPDEPVVCMNVTIEGGLVFILHRSSKTSAVQIKTIWLESLTSKTLIHLLFGREQKDVCWFKSYQQWQTHPNVWFQTMERTTSQVWPLLIHPLLTSLERLEVTKAILIPTGYLIFLPLHAAWTEDKESLTGRCYALDIVQFSYSPSIRSLEATRSRASSSPISSLLAIHEPCPSKAAALPGSKWELQLALSYFRQNKVLQHEQATRPAVAAALLSYSVLHFCCHGAADLSYPLNSGLLLANDEKLTLRDFFNLQTRGIRLVILSACETGISGINLPDEVINLPSGLIQAGVAAVIASLWSVDNLSTIILLSRFYSLWRTEGLEASQSLRQAQQWVRDTTNGEKATYFKGLLLAESASQQIKNTASYLYKSLILLDPDARAFAHPFYWAAFSYTGV